MRRLKLPPFTSKSTGPRQQYVHKSYQQVKEFITERYKWGKRVPQVNKEKVFPISDTKYSCTHTRHSQLGSFNYTILLKPKF